MPSNLDFTPWNEQDLWLIPHLSSATGDTIHVAAALALYDRLHVIIVHHGKVGSCKFLPDFYRNVTKSKKRVKVVYTTDEKTAYKISTALTNAERDIEATLAKMFSGAQPFLNPDNGAPIASVQIFSDLYLKPEVLPTKQPSKYTFVGNLGQATAAVAYKFTAGVTDVNRASRLKQIYTTLATSLSLSNLKTSDIIKYENNQPFFGAKPLPRIDGGPVVLLWARYSGTNSLTEYNPGGDSSIQGQAQLLKLLKKLKFNVITIGHGPRGGTPVESEPIESEFAVGEFYAQTPITADRASQTSFFLALMETYPGRLFQIGQKTGGMDCAALLGVPTLYLEHTGSHSYHRMQKWVDRVPFYQHSVIEFPPSRIGASLRLAFKEFAQDHKWGKTEPESEARPSALTRLACMIRTYPAEMDESKMTVQAVADWVSTFIKSPEQFWEVRDHPEADGEQAKKIRTANLKPMPAQVKEGQPVGYTLADLDGITKKLKQLQIDYSAKTAVIRTSGGKYETR